MVILAGFYRLVYLFPRESRPSTNFIDARNTYLAPDHHSFERLVDSCRQASRTPSMYVLWQFRTVVPSPADRESRDMLARGVGEEHDKCINSTWHRKRRQPLPCTITSSIAKHGYPSCHWRVERRARNLLLSRKHCVLCPSHSEAWFFLRCSSQSTNI